MSASPVCRISFASNGSARPLEPVTVGVPLPRGFCRDVAALTLRGTDSQAIPLQVRSLEQWPDGSHRWLLLDFQADAVGVRSLDIGGGPTLHGAPVIVDERDGRCRLTTGDLSIELRPGTSTLFAEVRHAGAPALDPSRSRLVLKAGGAEHAFMVESVTVEERGPLRGVVLLKGRAASAGVDIMCRLEMFAGTPLVRVRTTLHNPRAATHPGGCWELGDPGSVRIDRVALQVAFVSDTPVAEVRCVVRREDAAPRACATPFLIHQESSGRPNWNSRVHVSATNDHPLRYAGYQLTAGSLRDEGEQASPIVELSTTGCTPAVTSTLFWEVFPKAYRVDPDGLLHVEMLPEGAEPHELQGGERFRHECVIAFDGGGGAVEWARDPIIPMIDAEWWEASGALSYAMRVADPEAPYERLVRSAIDGDDTFAIKRDRIDEYGWRHYGDLYADHENGTASDRGPIVSHYNNQYDGVAGLITQFVRSGDVRWWRQATDLAAHVVNTDIYWTDQDKSAYNGGLFWHTYHYVDAGRSTHRSYPKADGVSGGGPSVEQNYSTGLLLHYLMTGDPDSREGVLRLARWTVDMDDGSLTVFRYLSGAPTGLASATGSADYHGPGRGPANAIHTLINAYRLTGHRAWLAKAEGLVRRCIHPADDLAARNLLDAERRWYYTVFLQALGRYLAFKTELGEEDATWRYARASLLHYARWMADHEYPYLEKPEILEYPTETWAAQDMRKCEALDLAAQYAETADERAKFVERARYFFHQSVTTLHQWHTHTWTRPTVLMLSYGYAHQWHEAHRATLPLLPTSPSQEWGRPVAFVPQKAMAMRRAKLIVAATAIAGLALIGLAIATFLY